MTGPPGTGKTQLVVNAVANAWLDGDKVLVTSTNNGAVDVAVERAEKDVIGGLLVRTGNRDVREQVPDRITAASAQAAAHRGNQAAARAQLKRVATERTQLMKKLARLDELDVKLLQVVEEQEELRQALKEATRTLWTNASPPELSISSHEIEQRARGLLQTWLFPRFRARRFRRRLGCLETATKTVRRTPRLSLSQNPKHQFFSTSTTAATHTSPGGSTRRSTRVNSPY